MEAPKSVSGANEVEDLGGVDVSKLYTQQPADSGYFGMSLESETSSAAENGPENGKRNDLGACEDAEKIEPETDGAPTVSTEIYTEQEEFLRAIHLRFLELVQPIQSGLTDELRAVGAMNGDEEEEVTAESTTRDRARKLWDCLHRVPPRLFGEKCMPILKRLYRHMLEGAEYRWEGQQDVAARCLRHAIMTRLTVKRFADVFPSTRCCNVQEYRNIIENKDVGEDQWEPVFRLLKENCTNTDLIEKILQVLRDIGMEQRYKLRWLKRQLRSGLPCMCRIKIPRKRKANNTLVVPDRVDGAPSETDYPQTCLSSERAQHRSPSISSIPSSKPEAAQSGSGETHQPEPFSSKKDMDTYVRTLRTVNRALADVSCIKVYYRQLEEINDQLTTMEYTVADASSGEQSDMDSDKAKRQKDLEEHVEYLAADGRARNIEVALGPTLSKVKTVLRDTDELCNNSIGFPPSCVSTLRAKRHLLDNEIREAEHFFEGSKKLFDGIIMRCRVHRAKSQETGRHVLAQRVESLQIKDRSVETGLAAGRLGVHLPHTQLLHVVNPESDEESGTDSDDEDLDKSVDTFWEKLKTK